MSEASIAVKLKDEFTQGVDRMEDANKGFNVTLEDTQKKAEQYAKRLSDLVDKQADLQVQLHNAKKHLKDVKKELKEAGDAADDSKLKEAHKAYNELAGELTNVTRAANDTRRALYDLDETDRKRSRSSGISSSGTGLDSDAGTGMLSQLGKSGALAFAGDLASQAIGTLATSFGGETMGNYVSNALSSAGMGAAIGSAIAPGVGTAIGAALGGLGGVLTGYMEEYANQDETFKDYVQSAVTGALEERKTSIQSGSTLAAQREMDAIAFERLLGEGVGVAYLEDVRRMGASTPMTYEGLTSMSRALATGFGDDPERMLQLMTGLGDAGSAVGIDEAGMAEMAKAMSRMESSGKASLEYLNIFQDRGVDVIGILSDGLGKTQAEIYDMISKSEIGGVEAVRMIQDALGELYGGAMEQQSKTFSGLSSTLEDMQNEMDAASGEGYNETRKKGMEEQIAWLEGKSGEKMQEINYAMGAFSASLENQKEEMIRDALDAVYGSQEYQDLMADGSDEAVAKAGEMLAAAKVQAVNEYNASEGAQLMVESELSLIETVRDNTALNDAYWDAGYRVGQEYDKGRAAAAVSAQRFIEASMSAAKISGQAAILENWSNQTTTNTKTGTWRDGSPMAILDRYTSANSHAYGLKRVPYDNYPALLHEGERVLTASEARSQSRSSSVQVAKLADQIVVREDADIDRIASALVAKLQDAMLTGVS